MTKAEKISQLREMMQTTRGLEQLMRKLVDKTRKENDYCSATLASAISSNNMQIRMVTKAVIKLMETQDDDV